MPGKYFQEQYKIKEKKMLKREEDSKHDNDIRYVLKKRNGNVELVIGVRRDGRPVLLERHLVKPVFIIKALMAKYSLCLKVFFYILLLFLVYCCRNQKP